MNALRTSALTLLLVMPLAAQAGDIRTELADARKEVRVELAKATPNKGGHRERALGLVDQAIAEVRAGIAFAATH